MDAAIITAALITIGIIILAAAILGRIIHITLHTRGTYITHDPGFTGHLNATTWIAILVTARLHPGLHAGTKDIGHRFVQRTGFIFVLQITGVMGDAMREFMGDGIRGL